MAITFTYKVENKVLKVFTQGKDDSLQDTKKYGKEVLGLSIKNECNKILCDERNLEYNLSVMDTFSLAEIASIKARGLCRIAIVCQEKYLDNGKFFETVSSNRGLIVLVTAELDQANEWLK
jgi:hypothetical protein